MTSFALDWQNLNNNNKAKLCSFSAKVKDPERNGRKRQENKNENMTQERREQKDKWVLEVARDTWRGRRL